MSNRYLCDTNVVSEMLRKEPDARVRQWLESLDRIAISVITLDEVHLGLRAVDAGRKERWFVRWVDARMLVLAVDRPVADRAARARADARRAGRAMTQADALIAATAVQADLTLATRNVRDFQACGASLYDPWGWS